MAPHLILRKYFLRKKKLSPSYSLRSFARNLKVNASFASRILSGKQEIPIKRLGQIAKLLDMDAVAMKDLKRSLAKAYLAVLGLNERDFATASKGRLDKYEDKGGSEKEMSVLSPWYNITIMEMATCENFVSDPNWIAKKLRLTTSQVQRSLDFLIANSYLRMESGRLIKTDQQIRIPTKKSLQIVRQFHKAMAEQAIKEMFENTSQADFDKRLITSTSMAINSINLPLAKDRLAEMQLEIAEILREGPCDQVYDLSLHLFPLTK